VTELELIVDFHKDAERQGPGSKEITKRAIELTGLHTSDDLKIADIGCGSGAQTLVLAKQLQGHITAVDLFPEFLEALNKNAEQAGLNDRISTLQCSMDTLPFADEQFDLLWSEGAIYIMGFEEGIQQWRHFLKPGGIIAVSEISWLTNERPEELQQYWDNAYPQIDTVSNKIKTLEQNGYSPLAHMVLPPSNWMENYYRPLAQRFEDFLNKHNYSEQAKQLIEEEKKEIQMYQQYQDYYSYGFYIAKKV